MSTSQSQAPTSCLLLENGSANSLSTHQTDEYEISDYHHRVLYSQENPVKIGVCANLLQRHLFPPLLVFKFLMHWRIAETCLCPPLLGH
ncbi:Uncharacterised protein [Bordetella pertussis]|nr:Uncharacterised protein [Bordetella pertussis]